jgi:hypothetical protein
VDNLGWLASSGVQPRKRREIEGVGASSLLALQAQVVRAQQEAALVKEGKLDAEELRARCGELFLFVAAQLLLRRPTRCLRWRRQCLPDQAEEGVAARSRSHQACACLGDAGARAAWRRCWGAAMRGLLSGTSGTGWS